MLARMGSNGNSHTLLVGMEIVTVTLGNKLAVSDKANINLPYNMAFPLLCLYPREIKKKKKKPTFTHRLSCI